MNKLTSIVFAMSMVGCMPIGRPGYPPPMEMDGYQPYPPPHMAAPRYAPRYAPSRAPVMPSQADPSYAEGPVLAILPGGPPEGDAAQRMEKMPVAPGAGADANYEKVKRAVRAHNAVLNDHEGRIKRLEQRVTRPPVKAPKQPAPSAAPQELPATPKTGDNS